MRFKDVLGCSSLDRQIEVIKGRPMKGVPALLKKRESTSKWLRPGSYRKRQQEEGWMATASH
ncbi:hypothetical protein [Prochlorococcus marinus]|uniref:hypothetical protein n=1 Tax=Prochlorococcus TaxID=1218 RepID=UPI001F1B8249|nr:hypothetical protein [Prochlorococcus marinus]